MDFVYENVLLKHPSVLFSVRKYVPEMRIYLLLEMLIVFGNISWEKFSKICLNTSVQKALTLWHRSQNHVWWSLLQADRNCFKICQEFKWEALNHHLKRKGKVTGWNSSKKPVVCVSFVTFWIHVTRCNCVTVWPVSHVPLKFLP